MNSGSSDSKGYTGSMIPGDGSAVMRSATRSRLGWELLLVLLVLVVFANSFPGAFITDDYPIVLDNPLVIEPNLRILFAADYWGWGVNSGLHRPLTILSYAVNRALFGPGVLAFHAVNVLLHAGVALLLLRIFLVLGFGMSVAWSAAAIFAVHPIHTEAVNIVTGRSELLAAFFLFFALLMAFRAGRWHRVAVGASYAAALLSKESAAVLPLLLVLGDTYINRQWRDLLRRRWALYAQVALTTLAWLAMRRWALPFAHLPSNIPYALDNPLVELPRIWGLFTALKVQVLYVGTMIFPAGLNAIYVESMFGAVRSLADPWWALLLLMLLAAVVITYLGWRRREAFALGMLWQGAAALVTANLFVVTPFLMAERFTYAPSAGFALAAAGLVAAAVRGVGSARQERAIKSLFVVWMTLLAGSTLLRNQDFQDGLRLWQHEVRQRPDNTRAWILLGGALDEAGRTQEAEEAYRQAQRLTPGFVETQLALGSLHLRLGRASDARDDYLRILEQGVTSYLALFGLARASLELGDTTGTLSALERLPSFFQERPEYWQLTGEALERAGEYREAANAYGKALACGGESSEIRERLRRVSGE